MHTSMMGRRRFGAGLIVATLVALCASPIVGTRPLRAESHAISIVDFAFEPGTLMVFAGEPVTWTNDSGIDHTVTSDEGSELDSGTIGPGEAYGHVFETPGTYTYHCQLHPDSMAGTIVVQPAPETPEPSGSPEPTPPSGTLPPDFNPFPSTGTPPASPSSEPSPTPAPSAEDGQVSLFSLPTVLVIAALGIAGGAALLARRRGRG